MNDLSAANLFRTARDRGPVAAVITLSSLLAFGVVDSFTAQIVPTVSAEIKEYFRPSTVILKLPQPVDITDGGIALRDQFQGPEEDVKVVPTFKSPSMIILVARPGNYLVTLTRTDGMQAVGTVTFVRAGEQQLLEIRPQDWLKGTPSPETAGARPAFLGPRVAVSEEDYALLATVQDRKLRMILTYALAEVGIDEDGSPEERQRVDEYWKTVTGYTPAMRDFWTSAFINWIMMRADLPYTRSSRARSWLEWGTEVPYAAATPGMVVIFKRSDNAGLAGILLRKHPTCAEIVGGNITGRVVIACITLEKLGVRRP